MPIGHFIDKNRPPSQEEIRDALASEWEAWQNLIQFVSETYGCTSELKFYGKNYGWALRYRKSGKALLSLYPAQDHFIAQMILSEPEIARAKEIGLGQNTLKAIQAANPYPEGRWLFIAIQSGQDLQDIQTMLVIKAPPSARSDRSL